MKDRILEMLKLQDILNKNTSGENWREGITKKGKIINWKRCIYMETAEAIDSVSWKHWKNVEGGIDYENLKVELIDVWHFLMSYLLIYYTYDELVELILKHMGEKANVKLPKELNTENNLKIDDILLPYENLMYSALTKDNSPEYREDFLKNFFVCLDSASVSFDDLYGLYIGKNVLNKFRQDNGYKEGTYIKNWNGQEDNVYMQEIIKHTSGFENIYKELEKIYDEVKNNGNK